MKSGTPALQSTRLPAQVRKRMRIKDVDFVRLVIIVRDAKGYKDHGQAQRGGVEVPHALNVRYRHIGANRAWFRLFPSPTLSVDPRSGIERRHHLYEDRVQRALKQAVAMAGIHKPVSVHTLRHSFATHVLKVAAGGTASPLDALVATA